MYFISMLLIMYSDTHNLKMIKKIKIYWDLNQGKMTSLDEHDILLNELEKATGAHDEQKVRDLYEKLSPLVELDFWCETFFDSEDWEIRIAADVRRKQRDPSGYTKLTIGHLILIKNIAVFEELLLEEVDMRNAEECIEELEYEIKESQQTMNNRQKIELIRKKMASQV